MLSLAKGQKLNLSKEFGLTKVLIGLGWNPRKFDSQKDFDLDASVFVLEEDGTPFGKVVTLPTATDGWVCYYGQPELPGGSVKHSGDARTGSEAVGDDEQITIDFSKFPPIASRVAVVVTIHEAKERGQNFGQVDDAYVNVYDKDEKTILAKFDLDESASTCTSLMFVEFKKNSSGEWVFQTVAEGFSQDLGAFFKAFKVPGF